MGKFKYTGGEQEINKVIKLNQEISKDIAYQIKNTNNAADKAIAESEELLRSLGYGDKVEQIKKEVAENPVPKSFTYKPEMRSWDEILKEANERIPEPVELEEILTPDEINSAFLEADKINEEFSRKTSIFNKTDLIFLAVATALQTTKALIYPYIAQQLGYGDSFDSSAREDHMRALVTTRSGSASAPMAQSSLRTSRRALQETFCCILWRL